MTQFILNNTLANETHLLVNNEAFYLGLHKNALIPWLILVPKTNQKELYACNPKLKQHIRETSDILAQWMQRYFTADKMNVATLGNVVSQLHIHIIARKHNDIAWPNPVWGVATNSTYTQKQRQMIINEVVKIINDSENY